MIYVIIGIVILVVSFIVALQSLVKEQNKIQNIPQDDILPEKDEDKPAVKKASSVLGEEAQRILKQSLVQPQGNIESQTQLEETDEAINEQVISREPFPWEKDFDSGAVKRTESEEDKIERLRSQIEQIKATQNVAKSFIDVEEGHRKNLNTSKGLSGEISLSDLKK